MSQTISQQRTHNYIKQIKGSFVFKSLAIVASYSIIPLMVSYLGHEQYGIWSTLLSIMSWVVFFDLGIGIGLRNKVAEALAKDNIIEASGYISSGYTLIAIFSFCSFVIASIAIFYIPWQKVFNSTIVDEYLLRKTILILVFFITLNFWISLINQVLNAVQKTSAIVLGQFISNALALFFVFSLTKLTSSSMYYLAIAYGVSLIITNIFLSLWFYRKRNDLIPILSLNKQHIQSILSLGLQFFTIQVAVLVIFTTDKILITQIFGPDYVTQYDVIYKLFGAITIVNSLIMAPLWSSYTDAYHRNDLVWIKSILRGQFMLFGIVVLSVLIMIPMTKPIIALWIGDDLEISMPLVISIGGFILISTWSNIFAYIVNGIGKIKFQLFSSIIAMIINIPLAIFFTKYLGFGVSGIVLATCVSLSLFGTIGPMQVYVILKSKNSS